MSTHRLASAAYLILAAAMANGVPASAAVPPAEAAKLKSELTPVGAEKAGNKDGSIPAWTGGFKDKTLPVAGRRPDPFASEKPLFSITAENAAKYADKLNAGTLAMLKKYPTTYRVDVYPTHRTAAMPRSFYDATAKNATQAKLVTEADGQVRIDNDAGGVPFPIPKDGNEVMMNLLTFYAPTVKHANGINYLIQADGRRVMVATYTNYLARYYTQEERTSKGLYQAIRSQNSNPPIRAGEAIVTESYTDPSKDTSWVYLPGQRRVRKLPSSCCDSPTPFSAGIVSFDEIGGVFFGSPHKFDWKLVEKKELFIPYNANKILGVAKAEDSFAGNHLNPDYVRWELHRVWVVEATLKAGQRHTSPRSLYYVDEDWWGPALADRFDAQGQLARTGYSLTSLMTETGSLYNAVWGWNDLLAGTAYVANLSDATTRITVMDSISPSVLSPDALSGDSAR